jgi:hypothetical protein
VYKGYSLPKDTEEYLIARGLKNAVYTINAADLKEDLFGSLMPCLFQVRWLILYILTIENSSFQYNVKVDNYLCQFDVNFYELLTQTLYVG